MHHKRFESGGTVGVIRPNPCIGVPVFLARSRAATAFCLYPPTDRRIRHSSTHVRCNQNNSSRAGLQACMHVCMHTAPTELASGGAVRIVVAIPGSRSDSEILHPTSRQSFESAARAAGYTMANACSLATGDTKSALAISQDGIAVNPPLHIRSPTMRLFFSIDPVATERRRQLVAPAFRCERGHDERQARDNTAELFRQ
jgi:hypothetical protein